MIQVIAYFTDDSSHVSNDYSVVITLPDNATEKERLEELLRVVNKETGSTGNDYCGHAVNYCQYEIKQENTRS